MILYKQKFQQFHLTKNIFVHKLTRISFQRPIVRVTAKNMGAKLKEVVTDSWQQEAVLLAVILDPSVKLSGFISAEEKQSAVSLLNKYVESYSSGIPSTDV